MTPSSDPSRCVPLAGASNFRDLGGYAGAGGRRVRWRRVFRADHLAALTAVDRERLAALVLLALGVPRDVVMQDYLLTNTLYRRPEGLAGPAPREVLEVLWRVQEDFLNAALDGVDRHPGGFDGYLAQVLGVDDAARGRLQALYLE